MKSHEQRFYKILSAIEDGKPFSQRSLARELGIALGLTNLLMKRLIKKGYVKTSRAIKGRRLKYLLTPAGIVKKTRLSVAYLDNTIRLYTETREKIRASLHKLASPNCGPQQRLVFYGAGEVAEIAYVTLNESAFELVGVVDDQKTGQKFFGHTILSPDHLCHPDPKIDYDTILVTTFRKSKEVQERFRQLQIPKSKVFFLGG
ncbi:MAG: winged helix-turn-helix transcriptional regulator [Acidobacteriota bacterium]